MTHYPLALPRTPHREAAAALAFRAVRFMVGGVVVYFLATAVGNLAGRFAPGAGQPIAILIIGIYAGSAIVNMTVAAYAWPESESELLMKVIVPEESETEWDMTREIWRRYRTIWDNQPLTARVEITGKHIRTIDWIAFEFLDGELWPVRPVRREIETGDGPAYVFELGTNSLSLKSLRHGQVVRGIVTDTDGTERRARVNIERFAVPPRKVPAPV